MKFVVPGIFLLILGIGNISVGTFKGDQYEQVLADLSAQEPTIGAADASPLRRIQLATQAASRLYQRQEKAQAKLDFYNLVATGGQVFVALSLIFFAAGLVRYIQLFRFKKA
jgi:hypothetical protein